MSFIEKLEKVESTIQWRIENFSLIDTSTGASIRSPVFQTTHPHSKKLPWTLKLYPAGFNAQHKGMGLFLVYLGDSPVNVSYSFFIIDDEDNRTNEFVNSERTFSRKNETWGTADFCAESLVHDQTKNLLADDSLLIYVIITATTLYNEHCDADGCSAAKSYFENVFMSGDLSDVTFRIGDKQMRLHKAIVASLSPVFFAMFQHQMKEKEESVVEINDVSYDIMEELFRYIYVRKINADLRNIAGALLIAADKYDVQELKMLCERFMCQRINEMNALQHLEFAVTYNASLLKSEAIDYVLSGLEKFVGTPYFERMSATCKDELLRAIAKNKVDSDTTMSS